MKNKTIGVLGLGLFGSSVATTLADNNIDVIAMDSNMNHVEEVADKIEVAAQGDFRKIDQLIEVGFKDCDEVIIASAEKLEDTILAIINLKKMRVPFITAKTKNEDYREVLLKVGADRVILPEVEMGIQLATMLANPTIHELIKLDNQFNVVEFVAHEEWVGKTIMDIDFRKKYFTNVIAVKPAKTNEFTIEFGPNYVVAKDDSFLGSTTDEGMKALMKELKE